MLLLLVVLVLLPQLLTPLLLLVLPLLVVLVCAPWTPGQSVHVRVPVPRCVSLSAAATPLVG